MSLKTADICYGCGLPWKHANENNHLCTMCKWENNTGKSFEELESEGKI